jgi:methyl coenzyme M reductase subunit C
MIVHSSIYVLHDKFTQQLDLRKRAFSMVKLVGVFVEFGTREADRERERAMAKSNEEVPIIEQTEPLDLEDAAEIGPRDSEVDFDDEQQQDQLPIDLIEAVEAGVLLDDPEFLSGEEG